MINISNQKNLDFGSTSSELYNSAFKIFQEKDELETLVREEEEPNNSLKVVFTDENEKQIILSEVKKT